MIEYRQLSREGIPEIWGIDRRERIGRIYVAGPGGLVLEDAGFDAPGWEPGRPAEQTPLFEASFDAGAWFQGAFNGERLVGIAVLERYFFGADERTLQLSFLHVSAEVRGTGVGTELFERARAEAKQRGAKRMYVSATPSENTVRFYLARGCKVLAEPDARLFALEPEDIHMDCAL
jgi:GNAT superfamily N-acetyltransferase